MESLPWERWQNYAIAWVLVMTWQQFEKDELRIMMACLMRLFFLFDGERLACWRHETLSANHFLTYEKEFANDQNRFVSELGVSGHHGDLLSGRPVEAARADFLQPSSCGRVSAVHAGDPAGAGRLVPREQLDAPNNGTHQLPGKIHAGLRVVPAD